jgi:hypothetical protein
MISILMFVSLNQDSYDYSSAAEYSVYDAADA